jgi:hypothetical protein
MWLLVESEQTEFATALLIYWRLEGPWILKDRDTEAKRLHDSVEDRLRSGYYTRRSLRYDPIEDNQLSKTQVYTLKKQGFPIELLEPNYSNGP